MKVFILDNVRAGRVKKVRCYILYKAVATRTMENGHRSHTMWVPYLTGYSAHRGIMRTPFFEAKNPILAYKNTRFHIRGKMRSQFLDLKIKVKVRTVPRQIRYYWSENCMPGGCVTGTKIESREELVIMSTLGHQLTALV